MPRLYSFMAGRAPRRPAKCIEDAWASMPIVNRLRKAENQDIEKAANAKAEQADKEDQKVRLTQNLLVMEFHLIVIFYCLIRLVIYQYDRELSSV